MEQKQTTDWQQIAIKEHALLRQTIHKAKHLLTKTTGYAKYLEEQNYAFEEKLAANNQKFAKAVELIKQLQRLAHKQKHEIEELQHNNHQLSAQIIQQNTMLRNEIAAHTQTEHALGDTKLKLQDALAAQQQTVVENNWQEFFVFKASDPELR